MNEEKQITSGEDKEDVKVLIEVSGDKVEAYITLIPLSESPEFTAEKIRKELSDKGIKLGVKEEVFDLLDKDIKYNQRMLIASGTRPVEGKDGTIEHYFEDNKTVKVKKGENIGEIIYPEEEIDGMTVFEEKIPARKVQEAKIPNLTNVGFSPENDDIFIAEIDGYLFINQQNFQLTPFFELEISDDKYEAYIKVKKPLNEGDFNSEDLKRFLTENGIVYGILEEEIENIFKQEIFGESILAAQGQRVVDEKDGEIKYSFETELKPQMDEKGNIDYKELNLIQNVRAGDKLAETSPPEQGIEGCTVFDKKIPQKKGVQPPLPTGKNTRTDPGNPNVLLSEIDGSVKLNGTNVEVEPVIIIKENVDFSTGNIDFNGPVIVNGDVKSGFKINAKGDVQVEGVVEDAVIETGSNVLIKTGFIGKGKGQIIAKGDVTAKFCENETIINEGDIYISEYVMHSNIQTKGTLYLTEKTGLIVGGEIYAVKGIEAKIVGNENYTPTALFAGVDKEFNEKLSKIKAHIAKNVKHIKDIEKILHKFSRRKLVKKGLPENMKNLMIKLNQLRDEKEVTKKDAVTEIKKLESKIDEFKKAVVKIFDVVYPGTLITIYNKHITVDEPRKYVYYKYAGEELVAADLEEL